MSRYPASAVAVSTLALALSVGATGCGTRVDRQAYLQSLTQTRVAQGPVEPVAGTAAGPVEQAAEISAAPGPRATSGSMAKQEGAKAAGPVKDSGLSQEVAGEIARVGFHVPMTGAAPMPTNYSDTIVAIQKWLNAEARVYGRGIEFVVEDDGYDATKSASACRKLADANPLFVIGHTMPAGQDACARLFNERKIPYMMRGTYPEILNGRPYTYFGTIADHYQGRYLAQYVLKNYPSKAKKAAVVYQNDQISAKDNFVATIEQGGGKIVVLDLCVPRQPDWAATIQKLQTAGAEVVLLSMPPVDAIKMSVQAQGQGYHPLWLGGSSWWNYNMVLESAGMALDGAIVLSSWASIDTAAAEEYKAIMKKYAPNTTPDDIGFVMYGWSMLLREAELKAGPNLSRATLVEALNSLQFSKPYWHPVTYTATNHQGATTVAVFRADGQAKRWRQITGFTSSF